MGDYPGHFTSAGGPAVLWLLRPSSRTETCWAMHYGPQAIPPLAFRLRGSQDAPRASSWADFGGFRQLSPISRGSVTHRGADRPGAGRVSRSRYRPVLRGRKMKAPDASCCASALRPGPVSSDGTQVTTGRRVFTLGRWVKPGDR